MMDKIINKANFLWGALVTMLSAIFGQFWYLFAAFLALNVVDYITGVTKSKITCKENSNKGWKGIAKKVGYWVVIAISFFMAVCFVDIGIKLGIDLGFLELVGWFTLATFIINEIRSILENLVIIGVDIPPFLIKGLEVASGLLDDKVGGSSDEQGKEN